jgi:hypothetical protein
VVRETAALTDSDVFHSIKRVDESVTCNSTGVQTCAPALYYKLQFLSIYMKPPIINDFFSFLPFTCRFWSSIWRVEWGGLMIRVWTIIIIIIIIIIISVMELGHFSF